MRISAPTQPKVPLYTQQYQPPVNHKKEVLKNQKKKKKINNNNKASSHTGVSAPSQPPVHPSQPKVPLHTQQHQPSVNPSQPKVPLHTQQFHPPVSPSQPRLPLHAQQHQPPVSPKPGSVPKRVRLYFYLPPTFRKSPVIETPFALWTRGFDRGNQGTVLTAPSLAVASAVSRLQLQILVASNVQFTVTF